MEIVILKQAKRELKDAPPDVIADVYSLFEDSMAGKALGMPISRPLPSIAKGLHELDKRTVELIKTRLRIIGL